MVFKVTTNIVVDHEVDYQFTTETIVDSAAEAHEVGRQMHLNILAYMAGVDSGADEVDSS